MNVIKSLFFCIMLSGTVYSVTLNETIDFALKNNRNILAAAEKVKFAAAKMTEAKAPQLPFLSFNASYNYLSLIPAFQIQVPGPMGTTITKTSNMGAKDNWLFKISAQQTFYSFGKISNTRKSAGLNLEVARREYDKAVSETVYSVAGAYYSAALARDLYELNIESLMWLEEHLSSVVSKYSSGAASQFDVLRASVQVSNFKPSVSKSKNNLELALLSLKNTAGMNLDENIYLDDKITWTESGYDYDSLKNDAYSKRPEILQASLKKDVAKTNLSVAETGNLPVLYGIAGYNYQNPFYNRVEWVDNWNAGIVLNYPFFDGFYTSAKVAQALSEVNQAGIASENVMRTVDLELKQGLNTLHEAQERVQSQKENIYQAEESLRISENNYKNGVATNLEVMDTQIALMQAKTNYLVAVYDCIMADYALKKASGNIIK